MTHILRPFQRTKKKSTEYESDSADSSLGMVNESGKKRKSRHHPNYRIAKYTENSTGDLSILAVSQIPVKSHQLT